LRALHCERKGRERTARRWRASSPQPALPRAQQSIRIRRIVFRRRIGNRDSRVFCPSRGRGQGHPCVYGKVARSECQETRPCAISRARRGRRLAASGHTRSKVRIAQWIFAARVMRDSECRPRPSLGTLIQNDLGESSVRGRIPQATASFR
jgi:hypothetical protein